MKAIVAVDKNWGIGKDNKLLFHIKEDMKFFKETTINKVVVMGRRTFLSLPNGEPLKDRMNLVITNKAKDLRYGNVVFGNMEEIFEELKKYDTNDVFVIGGGSIYKQLIEYCDTIYVTRVDEAYDADTFMPDLTEEGFMFEEVLDYGKTQDGKYWSIEKWIGCF